jgi:hypothetical protein
VHETSDLSPVGFLHPHTTQFSRKILSTVGIQSVPDSPPERRQIQTATSPSFLETVLFSEDCGPEIKELTCASDSGFRRWILCLGESSYR